MSTLLRVLPGRPLITRPVWRKPVPDPPGSRLRDFATDGFRPQLLLHPQLVYYQPPVDLLAGSDPDSTGLSAGLTRLGFL